MKKRLIALVLVLVLLLPFGVIAGASAPSFVFTQAVPHYDSSGTTWTSLRVENNVMMGHTPYHNTMIFDHNTWHVRPDPWHASLHNLEGLYTTLTGYIGRVDGSRMGGATIRFFGEGLIIETFQINAMDLPRQISVDVTGVQHLRIEVAFSGETRIAFAEGRIFPADYIPVTDITVAGARNLNPSGANRTVQLTATVLPTNATIREVMWSSDNPAVATVSATGLVTAQAVGTASIIATTVGVDADGNTRSRGVDINVVVPEVPVTSVSISGGVRSLNTGQTTQLTANVSPANATNRNVVWSSSNPAVATVNANGLVTALLPGSATITATTAGLDASGNTRSASVNISVSSSGTATNIFTTIWNFIMSIINMLFGWLL